MKIFVILGLVFASAHLNQAGTRTMMSSGGTTMMTKDGADQHVSMIARRSPHLPEDKDAAHHMGKTDAPKDESKDKDSKGEAELPKEEKNRRAVEEISKVEKAEALKEGKTPEEGKKSEGAKAPKEGAKERREAKEEPKEKAAALKDEAKKMPEDTKKHKEDKETEEAKNPEGAKVSEDVLKVRRATKEPKDEGKLDAPKEGVADSKDKAKEPTVTVI